MISTGCSVLLRNDMKIHYPKVKCHKVYTGRTQGVHMLFRPVLADRSISVTFAGAKVKNV